MSEPVVQITSPAQLAGLLKSSKIVVADFYADWCAPCAQIAPIYNVMAHSLSRPGAVTFTKVDTESQKEIAEAYRVTALPTFIIFRDGQVLERVQGADPNRLKDVLKKLATEVEQLGDDGNEGGDASGASSSGPTWLGASLPRGYTDVTSQIEIKGCELLNVDPDAGGLRVLFEPSKPSALAGGGKAKDWVESDTDEQLMLFVPFQAMIKLHTLQITSIPPSSDDDDDDDTPMRPRMIKLFSNKPHNLGFDEAEDMTPTQVVELSDKDWNKDGTASIGLRYVKFQNIDSLVLFVVDGDGDSEKVRLDRIRLIGESGEKREMGKLEKIGEEQGE